MKQSLIFILLMVISVFINSCGSDNSNIITINTQINMHGFLNNFRGGKIKVSIYNNSTKTCDEFMDLNNKTSESKEKSIVFNIPEGTDKIELSKNDISITPGIKTIYAILYDKNNTKVGHDCKKAIRCSALGTSPTPDDAYNIIAGQKACVYLDINLIP